MLAIVYFSHSGETLIEGEKANLSQGNTEIVAKKIANQLELSLFRLIPQKAYPKNYDQVVIQAKNELIKQEYPAFESISLDLKKTEQILLGYPNWWGTFPRIIGSFLMHNDMTGKIICPFCTHEGSGLGNSLSDLERICPQAIVERGVSIRGSRVERADLVIQNWLQEIIH
ncbi:flavodoxin [Enterococcus sp. LJL99]